MKGPYFFSQSFRIDFLWKNRFHLRVGSVLPQNKDQISTSLKFMSSETIRNRFSGSKKAFTEEELRYLTVLDGINHYAIGIEEARYGLRGVGLIRMVRSSTVQTEAEIAITLIDEYQNMGLGTFLLNLMILACHERGITALSFTFLPSNESVLKLIQKAGKVTHLPSNHDSTHVCLEMNTLDLVHIKNEAQRIIPVLSDYQYTL